MSTKIFSISIGIDAKHLYVCSGYHHNISLESFNKQTKSFIEADSKTYVADSLPRDGIGCWHPLFPARIG
ncbi:hypothetical protein PSL50_18975, partial [Clostridioides difficile]|nr:hypothetical protein [Clostridioides difficile]